MSCELACSKISGSYDCTMDCSLFDGGLTPDKGKQPDVVPDARDLSHDRTIKGHVSLLWTVIFVLSAFIGSLIAVWVFSAKHGYRKPYNG